MTESIVVGFDDTEHSFRAVDCAIREAEARRVPLRLVNAYRWIPPVTYGIPPGLAAEEAVRGASVAVLEEAAAKLRAEHPGLVVETVSASSDPAPVLADESRRAPLLVVGGRARTEGHAGMRVGALAHTILHHAHCPVIVVPEH